MPTLRSSFAALLVTAALIVGGFSLIAHWTQQHVLDSRRWTDAVAPLVERPAVQRTVTSALVEAVEAVEGEGRVPVALRPLLTRATAQVVDSPQFARAWATAVRLSHDQVVAGIRDQGRGLALADHGLVVDLGALFESLAPQLVEMGIPYVDDVPRPAGEIVLDSSPDVVRALNLARVLDRWATPSLVGAVLLGVAGIACARRRRLAVMLTGVGVTLAAVAGWVGWRLARAAVVDSADPITSAVLRSLTSDVSTWLGVTAGGAVAVAVVSGLAGAQNLRHRLALR